MARVSIANGIEERRLAGAGAARPLGCLLGGAGRNEGNVSESEGGAQGFKVFPVWARLPEPEARQIISADMQH